MARFSDSPFYQLHELAERCLSSLGEGELNPKELWMLEDPQRLAGIQTLLIGFVDRLESELRRLAKSPVEHFTSVTELEEWLAIEKEIPGWRTAIENLRPAADPVHVKERLMSLRIRISELIDQLAVRSAVRDPGNRASNSHEAMRSVAFLIKERELRELALGLLEGGTWEETLVGSVADWSIRFGPQHRLLLAKFSSTLGDLLGKIDGLPRPSRALRRLTHATSKLVESLGTIQRQLAEVPLNRTDAGIASDLHYMAELAKKIVDTVTGHHGSVIADYAGQPLPTPVSDLFRRLHLAVPRARATSQMRPLTQAITQPITQPMSREELERELGRHLTGHGEDLSEDLGKNPGKG